MGVGKSGHLESQHVPLPRLDETLIVSTASIMKSIREEGTLLLTLNTHYWMAQCAVGVVFSLKFLARKGRELEEPLLSGRFGGAL